MEQFDREVLENFRDMERPAKPAKITGVDANYNFVEDCHKFRARQFEIKGEEGFHEQADICHIISINARGNPIERVPDEVPRGGKKKKGGRSRTANWIPFFVLNFHSLSIFAIVSQSSLKMRQITIKIGRTRKI